MPTTYYDTSYWIDRLSAARRPTYPRFKGQLHADIAVVGGGAFGCAAAYVFAAAGQKVVLLEEDRLAQGQAGYGTGIIIHEPGPDFHKIAAQHGVRDARHIFQTSRKGSLECVAALRRLRIECGLRVRTGIHLATTSEGIERLEKEYRARREAGIDGAALKGLALLKKTGLSGFGIVTHGNATVDPYRATLGLARAAAARGAMVFEHSAARRIRQARRGVQISCNGGVVAAAKVVVATGYPTDDFKPLRRRFARCDSYAVLTPELPAAIRRGLTPPDLIVREAHSPDHWLQWVGERVLFAGADQPSVGDRVRDRALVQRTGQLMYELSVLRPDVSGVMPEYSWQLTYPRTIDGVPYFGPHRNYPHHYFAFGGGGGGFGLGFTAARIMLRHFQDAPERGDEPLSFTRIRE